MTTLTRAALEQRQVADETFDIVLGEFRGKARRLDHTTMSEWRAWMTDETGELIAAHYHQRKPRLVVLALLDADGNRMFSTNEADAIGALPDADVDALYEQITKGCGMKEYQEETDPGKTKN